MSKTVRRRNHPDIHWHVYRSLDLAHYRTWSCLSVRWTEESLLADHCQRVYGHTDVEKARKTALAYFHSDGFRDYGMGSIPRSYRNEAERMLRAATRRCTDKIRKLVDLEDIGDVERPSKRILSAASRFYW